MPTSHPQVSRRILCWVVPTFALELAPAHMRIVLWRRSIAWLTRLPLRPWIQGPDRLPGVKHDVQVSVKVAAAPRRAAGQALPRRPCQDNISMWPLACTPPPQMLASELASSRAPEAYLHATAAAPRPVTASCVCAALSHVQGRAAQSASGCVTVACSAPLLSSTSNLVHASAPLTRRLRMLAHAAFWTRTPAGDRGLAVVVPQGLRQSCWLDFSCLGWSPAIFSFHVVLLQPVQLKL